MQWWMQLERETGMSVHATTGIRYYALVGSTALTKTVQSLTQNERRHYTDPYSPRSGPHHTCVVEPDGGAHRSVGAVSRPPTPPTSRPEGVFADVEVSGSGIVKD